MSTLINTATAVGSKVPAQVTVVVRSAELVAVGVKRFIVAPVEGALPDFTAGSHVSIGLGAGLWRSYSLTGTPGPAEAYEFAVGLAPDSRGGSRAMHDDVHEGDLLTLRGPHNTFPLEEHASHSLMIAGGIGITPFVSMTKRLNQLRRPWTLHYAARTRQHMAFLGELEREATAGSGELILHPDDESVGRFIDLREMAAEYETAHAYCCGPPAMLSAYTAAFAHFPASRVHFESFKPTETGSAGHSFQVMLARSGRVVAVPEGKSILECLEAAGLQHPYSCREGTCGTCETGVLKGTPDHRDTVLSERDRRRNDTMMVCVSRSLSAKLVLDL
jgi:ferredoxin-NADP reductase